MTAAITSRIRSGSTHGLQPSSPLHGFTESDCSGGLLSPALFTAVALQVYSEPLETPVIDVSAPPDSAVAAGCPVATSVHSHL